MTLPSLLLPDLNYQHQTFSRSLFVNIQETRWAKRRGSLGAYIASLLLLLLHTEFVGKNRHL